MTYAQLAFGMPGPQELLIISGVLVLMFGATRIPKLARAVGESIKELKVGLREAADLDEEDEHDEDVHRRRVD